MKNLILIVLLVIGITGVFSQNVSAQQDSTRTKRNHRIFFNKKVDFDNDTVSTVPSKGKFIGGISLTRFDLGFSKLVDNGSYTLTPQNQFLGYKAAKTSTFSFDVIQFGYRFNQNFKIYVAGGFDWTLIRLKQNITIQPNGQTLTYINEPINFSKNRFSSSYVHMPLNFEFRTKENDNGKRFYFVVGPEIGFLLNGKVKQISDERGKQKVKDDYHFQPFRYGGTVRIGYGGIGLFTKYYMNDMFDTPAQSGLKNMSFGITFGIN